MQSLIGHGTLEPDRLTGDLRDPRLGKVDRRGISGAPDTLDRDALVPIDTGLSAVSVDPRTDPPMLDSPLSSDDRVVVGSGSSAINLDLFCIWMRSWINLVTVSRGAMSRAFVIESLHTGQVAIDVYVTKLASSNSVTVLRLC